MPTEKKDDDTQDVEQKKGNEQNTGENQNQKVTDDSKVGGENKTEDHEKELKPEDTKTETSEADGQPVEIEKPGIGDLNYYSEVRKDLPEIKPGDIIRISYRVIEGGKERIQVFEGTVIALKHSGISRTVTVRKTSFGISVERIFPLNSKLIQKIQIKKHSKVRRAKLYYLRKLKGKAARLKELR
ncbi:MAG: 50S ribosomal protein L19 [Candidatus Aminicenantes bacterium]|nr:50S ribosomal protein L19 [Candidatus Aminicenantes bacterium]